MQLLSFRVQNYRSIIDSGEISVSRITALLGRNESGKSNLLRALHSLNPIEGFDALRCLSAVLLLTLLLSTELHHIVINIEA